MCIREESLRQKVDASLVTVRKVFDTARNPQLAEDVHHKYVDKYLLAEYMTNGQCASLLTTLRLLGVTDEHMKKMKQWSSDRTVTMRFSSRHKCTFLEKKTREVDSDQKEVVSGTGLGSAFNLSRKTVTTVTEYFWNFECGYELIVYKGNEPQEKIVVMQRDGASTKVKTTTEKSPQVEAKEYPDLEVDLTWFLQQVKGEKGQVSFSIDRSHKKCLTPLRNEDSEKAVSFSQSASRWARKVTAQLQSFFNVVQDNTLDMASLQAPGQLFLPFAPLFEEEGSKGNVDPSTQSRIDSTQTDSVVEYKKHHDGDVPAVLGGADLEALLLEEERQIVEKLETVGKAFPTSGLITREEARVMILLHMAMNTLNGYFSCMNYLETMLRKQLVAAIGKEITASDFAAYMQFHNRKMFKEEYAPKPLCLAVRRPNHYPEGTVSIMAKADSVTGENPTLMLTRKLEAGTVPQMRFALSAAAEVTLCGETEVHACIGHRFSFEQPPAMTLAARSRQFSGYVLLLGRIGGADLFLPSHAMLVQNKDEFDIPLMLDEIPSAKEFRDAIESLSPEQQRFAKAYRSMQLESTLFAVCIVQIKPQLEKVLNLPYDSLTKEIQLTQRLLELFIEYHIPPDLVSFQCDSMEDPDDIPAAKKVEAVKAHVDAMFEMIKDSKQKEVDEQKVQHEMDKASAPLLLCDDPVVLERGAVPQMKMAAMSMSRGGMRAAPGAKMMMMESKRGAPVPVSAPVPAQVPTPTSAQPTSGSAPAEVSGLPDGMVDVSTFPTALEQQFDTFSDAACIRPTVIKPAHSWTKRHQPKLLSAVKTSQVGKDQQTAEKNKAFDLLDALTRSGVLSIEASSMHVVLGATHCFDETLVDTLVKKNVNPIEHVERSMLIVASTLFGQQPRDLVKNAVVDRVEKYSPMLFLQ